MKNVAGKAHRWLVLLVILHAGTACDNVEWAGADIALRPPPSAEPDSASADSTQAPPPPEMPDGPVLFAAFREGNEVSVVPVAELAGDSLAALPDDVDSPAFDSIFASRRMTPGTRFVLLAGGARVGSARVDALEVDASFCSPRPSASGVAELLPSAAGVTRFLALREAEAEATPWAETVEGTSSGTEETASIRFMGQILPELGARWPSDVRAARRDLRAFRLGGDGPEAFAATFLFRDELGVRPAEEEAWAIFLLGVDEVGSWERAFEWYRPVAEGGRAVPVFHQQHDWDGDGSPELLLEVQGSETRWMTALERSVGGWSPAWVEPCAPEPSAAADTSVTTPPGAR